MTKKTFSHWSEGLEHYYFGPAWAGMRREMTQAVQAYDGDLSKAWRDAHAVLHKAVWRYEGDVADDTADNNYVAEVPRGSRDAVMAGIFSKMMEGHGLILKNVQDLPSRGQCKLTMSVQSTEVLKSLVHGMKVEPRDIEAGRSGTDVGVRL